MRRFLIACLLALPVLASADVLYANVGTNGLQSSAGSGTITNCTASPIVKTYTSVATAGLVTLGGTVTMAGYGSWDTSPGAGYNVTFEVGSSRGGTACTSTHSFPGGYADTAYTMNCAAPSVTLQPGDTLYYKITLPANSGARCITLTMGANIYADFPLTAAGVAPCTCSGLCAGAACGTALTSAGSWPNNVAGTCDCTTCSQAITGPTLACAPYANGSASCSWGSVPGAISYSFFRGATGLYTGAGQSYLDQPGSGTFTYNVYGAGNCTPDLGGNTYFNKLTTTTNKTVQIVAGGYVGLLGWLQGRGR